MSAQPRHREVASDLVAAFGGVEQMVGALQRLPVPWSFKYPAFRRDHWAVGPPIDTDMLFAFEPRLTTMARNLIGYVRVSTDKQGKSGLGIEAQKQALERFAAAEGFALGRVYGEVETGKGSDAKLIDKILEYKAALLEDRTQAGLNVRCQFS